MHFYTVTGREINLNNVTEDDICGFDIAHSLSNQCRFAGHTKDFYSVAQHCVRVAKAVPPEYRLTALLHDAAEAYAVDVPLPLKEQLPYYRRLESKIQDVINQRYRLIQPLPEIVKQFDLVALATEIKELTEIPFPRTIDRYGKVYKIDEKNLLPYERPMCPNAAKFAFLRTFTHCIVEHYDGVYSASSPQTPTSH